MKLEIPYRSQKDNLMNPGGSCNVTSIAMCLEYLGASRKTGYENFEQFEDELYQYAINNGYDRHSPHHLANIVEEYRKRDRFLRHCTIEQCQDHLDGGHPCVVHGYFTRFGHIIVLAGYDAKGFIVHDPYGEWFSTGYRKDLSGAFLHYSYDMIKQLCIPDGEFWVHLIS